MYTLSMAKNHRLYLSHREISLLIKLLGFTIKLYEGMIPETPRQEAMRKQALTYLPRLRKRLRKIAKRYGHRQA